ncbi:MAG: hypothetical protein NUV51_10980 [Sulfuricaulis sp.]|nr:hypothetical protein [Sulfuricaulis sp.]
MNAQLETVIKTLVAEAEKHTGTGPGADAALKYTQAALNVAHVLGTIEAARSEASRRA